MAHRGKLFPVHFRRDFSANANIQNPGVLAEGYDIILQGDNTVPSVVNGHLFHLSPVDQPDPASIQWRSETELLGGQDWDVILRVTIVQTVDVLLKAVWFLFRNEFLASSWQSVPANRLFPVQRGPAAFGQVLFTAGDVFPHGANFNFSDWHPTGYPP